MKYRLMSYDAGWIVEYKTGFFSKWKPVTHFRGSISPYYYRNATDAIEGALREIKDVILTSI